MQNLEKLSRFLARRPCRVGDVVTLDAEQSRHMSVVLRIGRGEHVRVFTGRGDEFIGQVEQPDPRAARVRICGRFEPARPRPAHLIPAFAPPPGQRADILAEKATELGAARLQPLLCERLQGFQAEAAARRMGRWRRKAEEAGRQSQRSVVPELRPPVRFESFVREIGCEFGGSCEKSEGPRQPLRLIAAIADARSLWQVLADTADVPSSVTMVVGPAGGFTRGELQLAAAAGLVPVSLGPQVLRVETAAISLLAGVVLWLDGIGAPPDESS